MTSNRIAVLLAVLVVLAGCTGLSDSAQESGQQSAGSNDLASEPSGAAGESADRAGGAVGQIDAASQERAIVRSGRMVVRVSNFSQSREAITAQVRATGGYVNSTNRRRNSNGEQTWITGTLVLRIPSGNYTAMQENVSAQGTVLSEWTGTRDVTDQLVDIQARLDNLRDRRDRLRTLYEQADTTDEVLRVEEELSEVQGEIERLEARQRSLENQVAYSTLRVELREDDPGPNTDTAKFHEQPLLSVLSDSLGAMYVAGRTLLVLAVAALPWVVAVTLPLAGVYRLLRRRGLPFIGGSGEADDDAEEQ